MGIFALVWFLFDAALFWIITVFVSQQHRLEWWEFVLWMIIAKTGSGIVEYASSSLGDTIASIFGLFAMCVILFFALHSRFGVGSRKEKFTIISLYFGLLFIRDLIF
ncbi:MAG: hypothetical protein P9L92_15840 [Candidatus Electryonea clarkiae]|nr:hypothetical protein [Candidatus Electryonea clarkiae]MDP8285782.1 hypothetical protein [Candidatus Electryonea clarkiae]